MDPSTTTPVDAAAYLDSEEMMAEYLRQALASDDPDLCMLAMADIAKAKAQTPHGS